MPGHNAKRASVAVVMACAFVSGCVTRPVYEESWAEQVRVKSGACPDIDGVYQNTGEAFSRASHDTRVRELFSLAHVLNGAFSYVSFFDDDRLGQTFTDPAKDAHQTVSLQLTEGMLHIEAVLADGSTRTFDLAARGRCRDSTMLVEADWKQDDEFFVRTALALGRAEDGSLLVYRTTTEVVFFLVPLAGHDAAWIRFPPVSNGDS